MVLMHIMDHSVLLNFTKISIPKKMKKNKLMGDCVVNVFSLFFEWLLVRKGEKKADNFVLT